MSTVTGLLSPVKPRVYFFSGDRYTRYEVGAKSVEAGFPRPIKGYWPGLFDSGIDAALPWPDKTVHWFKGDRYVKYDMAADKALGGYPKPIVGDWPGVFTSGIDAALLWPGGERAFFFQGGSCQEFDVAAGKAADPVSIAGAFPALAGSGFENGVDTAFDWPGGHHVYFFRGDDYVKLDVAAGTVLAGYPKAIAGNWPGLPFGAPVAVKAKIARPAPPPAGAVPEAVEDPGGQRLQDKTPLAEADKVTVEGAFGREVPLHKHAATWWWALIDAARADGIADPLLLPSSGYRTAASEEALWARALKKYGSETEARKWVAKPGGSPHRTGRAIDCYLGSAFGSEHVEEQHQTAAWQWLRDNAVRFGFYPYTTEPWHWEYNPPR